MIMLGIRMFKNYFPTLVLTDFDSVMYPYRHLSPQLTLICTRHPVSHTISPRVRNAFCYLGFPWYKHVVRLNLGTCRRTVTLTPAQGGASTALLSSDKLST